MNNFFTQNPEKAAALTVNARQTKTMASPGLQEIKDKPTRANAGPVCSRVAILII